MKRFLIIMVALCLAVSVEAESVVTIETKDIGKGSTETGTMFVQGNNVAMQSASENSGVIFRGDKGLMYAIDNGKRSYIELNKESLNRVGNMMNDAMKQMEAQLANVPPAQRAMMEQMIKSQMPAGMGGGSTEPIEIKKTTETQKINGYDCVKYEAKKSGEKIREFWVTKPENIQGGKETMNGLRAMGDFMSELLSSLQKNPLLEGMAQNPFAAFKNIDGIPIVSREYRNGKLESETTLKDIAKKPLDPSTFEPPAGYAKEDPFAQLG